MKKLLLGLLALAFSTAAYGQAFGPSQTGRGVTILGASAVAVTVTGTLTETVLGTVTVPADAMGPNGTLRVTTVWSTTNSGNNKTPRVRLGGIGGTTFHGPALTTSSIYVAENTITNRNATNSQIGGFNAASSGSYGTAGASPTTGTIDTTIANTIVFTGQLTNTGESIVLEKYLVELIVP